MNNLNQVVHRLKAAALILVCVLFFTPGRPVSADVNQPGPTYTVTTNLANGDGVCTVSECTLREAIQAADADGVDSVINLQDSVNYELSDFVDNTKGQTALSPITSPITIHGNSSSIFRPAALTCNLEIPNEPEASEFRFFYISPSGSLALDNLTLKNGCLDGAGNHGGAIYNEGGLSLEDVGFEDNKTARSGGAITIAENATANIQSCTFINSRSSWQFGGHIWNQGTLTLANSTLTTGWSLQGGGGLYNTGNAEITASQFTDNYSASSGGGLMTEGPTNVTGCDFSNNEANFQGGGIYILNTTANISDTTIKNNLGRGSGGGIANDASTTTIEKSLITSNSAKNGGGVYHSASDPFAVDLLTVRNVQISNNQSSENGGGIYAYYGIINLEFSNVILNRANKGLVTPDYATYQGGGIYRYNHTTITMKNSILAENDVPYGTYQQSYGSITSLDYNLFADTAEMSSTVFASHDILNLSPLLGPLQDNGGPTNSSVPLIFSPVVDVVPAGINGCGTDFLLDQRGYVRPADAYGNGSNACDIGAVEANANSLIPPFHVFLSLLRR